MSPHLQLPALGVAASSISFTTVSMESDKCVCVRETATQPGGQNSVVIVDTTTPGGGAPVRRPITADSALMSPASKVIALKVAQPGTQVDQLQVRLGLVLSRCLQSQLTRCALAGVQP